MATPSAPFPPAASRSVRTSGLAIAGLVLAFLAAPIGLVLSAVALGQITASKGQLGGRGLAIGGFVVGIVMTLFLLLAAIAIPSFLGYMHASKSAEVRINLRKIEREVKVYYMERTELPPGPAPLTPAQPCCTQPGHMCQADAEFAASPAWQAIDFQPGRSAFQYGFTTTANQLVATATGDPSCDGNPVTYKVIIDVVEGNPISHYEEPQR